MTSSKKRAARRSNSRIAKPGARATTKGAKKFIRCCAATKTSSTTRPKPTSAASESVACRRVAWATIRAAVLRKRRRARMASIRPDSFQELAAKVFLNCTKPVRTSASLAATTSRGANVDNQPGLMRRGHHINGDAVTLDTAAVIFDRLSDGGRRDDRLLSFGSNRQFAPTKLASDKAISDFESRFPGAARLKQDGSSWNR
jgi:hypothetical protein